MIHTEFGTRNFLVGGAGGAGVKLGGGGFGGHESAPVRSSGWPRQGRGQYGRDVSWSGARMRVPGRNSRSRADVIAV